MLQQASTSTSALQADAPQAAAVEKEQSKQGWGQTRIYEVQALIDSTERSGHAYHARIIDEYNDR